MHTGARDTDSVEQICRWYQDHVRGFLETFAPKRIDDLDRELKRITAWQQQIGEECAVCFVGHSGVGKSTLINALVDDRRSILPQGGIGPLTAQATSVRWAATPYLEATYLPPRTLNQLAFSLECHHENRARSAGSATASAPAELPDLDPEDREEAEADAADAAAVNAEGKGSDRIQALVRQACLLVRGDSTAEADVAYLADCLRAGLGQTVRHGHEPTAEDAPRVESLRRALHLSRKNKAYRREGHLTDHGFLDELRAHAAGNLAPLIQTLEVGWNSPVLSHGLALVDLPGLGIANDQYHRVTQEWTREKAKAIALVVDRAGITQDSAELLRSSGFFGRLLHAADAPSADPVQLLVVAVKLDLTANDDWQRGKDRDPDRAGPWTEYFQAAQEQMETRLYREVKGAIVGALRQSTSDTSEPGLDQVAKHLMDDLAIHVVSAPQFRSLWRQDPEDPARIREPEQSGMPQLRECLRALASQRDTLLRDRIVTAGDQFRERIFRTLEVIRSQGGDGTRAEEENTRIRAELHSFLFGPAGPGTEFRSRQGGFREFLSSTGTKGIQDTVERAAHTAEKHVRAYLETELSNAHWATLRAAVRRGGTYHGARRIDLPNDFAVRIDEPLGFAWSKEILASVRQRTSELGKAHLAFVDRVAEWACIRAEAAREPLEALRKQTRSDMRAFDDIGSDRVDQLRSAVRQRLLQRIGLSIRRECKSFVESHRDVGRGVKLRMLDLIEGLVPSVMEVARDSAVKIMQSEFRSVERDIRAAVDDHRDPIEGVSEAIAPSARTEPELPTRIEAITAAAPVEHQRANGHEQHAVPQAR